MNCSKLCRFSFILKAPASSSNSRSISNGLPAAVLTKSFSWSATFRSKEAEKPGKITAQEYIDSLKTPESPQEEVYYGPLSPRIKNVKLFSLMTSACGICAQPVILQRAAELEASSAAVAATCGVVGFFTFITPLLLHAVTKKYVTTVTWDKEADAYTATIYTLFLRKRMIRFKPGEAEVPEIGGLTSAKIRGVPLFLDSRFFSDIYHYKRIMGYDKPMDFKLAPKKDVT